MTDTFEKIKLLQQEARDRNIYGMGEDVAVELGTGDERITFTENDLEVWYDSGGPNLRITYKGISVYFNQIHTVIRYRPDIPGWIEQLTKIYETRAKPKMEAKEQAAKAKAALELFDKWGIVESENSIGGKIK